jgi:serine/alanine adding enzyme
VVLSAWRGSRLVGLAPVIIDRLAPLPLVGSKAFLPCGLLAEDEETHAALLRGLLARLRRRGLYLEIFDPGRGLDGLRLAHGFRADRHRNYLLDLRPPIEEIRARYSRAVRRNLRQAEAHGLRMRRVGSPLDLRTVHRLLQSTSERVAAPSLPWELLKAVHHRLAPLGMSHVYLAEQLDGTGWQPVNTRVELVWGGRAIDWYTGAARGLSHLQAGPWLVDQVLEDLRRRGVTLFDFGGAGRAGEDYGPAEFKRRFGGREIEVTRYQAVFHPRLTRLAAAFWRRFVEGRKD